MEKLCIWVGVIQKLTVGKNLASEKRVGWRKSRGHISQTLSVSHDFAYRLHVEVF